MKWHVLIFMSVLLFGNVPSLPAQLVLKTSKKTAELKVDTVHSFKNASFEEFVFSSHEGVPKWTDCGFKNETPPAVHMGQELFEVSHQASDGKQYISMVTREQDNWEAISQELDTIILQGKTYTFSINLAISEMKSHTRFSQDKLVSFYKPITLRIWGGNEACQMNELLYTSPTIDHKEWKKYEIAFTPVNDMDHITIQAFYQIPSLFPYNGNILVDNLSAILESSN